jgi:ferredoxin
MSLLHRRFWCRNLCPAGALLGLFSKWRWYRRRVSDTCTSCGLCYKRCRMGAVKSDYLSTNHIECISCMECQKVCPVNAVHFQFVKKPSATTIVDFSRRRFVKTGMTGLLSAGILKIGFTDLKRKGYVIRPPGASEEDDFLDRCVRCGECVRVCSSAGEGLQLAGLETGWTGIWTPVLMPKSGYCEYNCNLCGQVCPTAAIHPLSVEEKQKMKMGTAHFDKTRCIPWYYGENCMVCEEHCPLPEKAIQFHESKIITIEGENAIVLLPFVDESLCIGCGICVTRCPVEGDRGIFLTNADEERWNG